MPLENGRSVPARRVTWYWSGVSSARHSSVWLLSWRISGTSSAVAGRIGTGEHALPLDGAQ